MEHTDHDLLIRISEQIAQARDDIRELKDEVASLQISRARFYGFTAALSAAVSIAMKVIWP